MRMGLNEVFDFKSIMEIAYKYFLTEVDHLDNDLIEPY